MNRDHVYISRRAGGSGFMPSWFILLLTIILLAGTAANSYGLSFGPAANYAAGTTPYAVAVSDFDGDGRTDLAAANYGSNTVSVLLGNGDGTFQAAVNFAAGTNPTSVAAADFDGNGAPDLAVTNEGDRKISILLGNGNGTFQPAATYTVGNEPSSVAISDLNKDGRLDLVIANYRSNNVSVLLGNGNGTFQARINYTTGGTRPYSVTTGDFNSDGNIDLAVANGTSSNISVLLGSGGGTFAAAVLYPTGTAPRAVASGDFNGDGNADLASANSGSNGVSVLLGNGDGTFQAAVAYAAGTSPLSVTTGDMNGDGKPDLGVANSGSSDVSILLGNGDGTFQATVAYAGGTSPRSVAAGYFNSDGKQDLATANSGGNTVSVLLNTSAPETTLTSGPSGTVNVSTADFTFISEAGATFECDLDGAGYAVCASPAGYTGLTDGLHTFMVRAKDTAGTTDPTPAGQSWTIDTTPPDTTILTGPSGTVNTTTATFTFDANEPGTFECELDGGGYAACTSPQDYTGLSDGAHTFMVRAKDALGNTDASPANQSWTVDTTAPETSILSGPSGTVNVTTASFTFSANEPGTFECELDGTGYVACANPADYTGLADGPHTFMVKATDAMGYSDLTPASQSWTVDTIAPETAITGGPSGTVNVTTASFTFSSEPGATFECELDGAGYVVCASPADYAGLADGPHTFMVRAKDAAGNTDATPASQSWTIDTTAPETSILSGPSGTVNVTTASFTFSANEPGTFECELDGTGYVACANPADYTGLADGPHTFMVKATDAMGYTDLTPASQSWTVDATAPDTTITGGPSGTVSATTASFTFSSEVGATFECDLDGSGYAACTSPKDYLALADGPHTFMVRAKDTVGNTDATPASQSWTVDTTAPETTITGGPSGTVSATTASFTFTSEVGVTFECDLDGSGYAVCTSPKDYTGLADGIHTFMVRAKDVLGNTDASPASRNWTIDTIAPDTAITGGPSGTVSATTASFTFTSEVGATFECDLDGSGYAVCTSPRDYLALADGLHTFMVRAKDALGNTDASPASQSWTVDATAPDTTITSGPSGTVSATTASFTFISEVGATFECQLDGAGYAVCVSPKDYTGLSDGAHTFMARAKDALGNTDASPASQSWTIDSTAPVTTITAGPSGMVSATSASFTFTSEVGATFECQLDGSGYAVCTSPQDYLGLTDGPHTFMVRAKDALGNTEASPASQSWTIDTTAPETSILSGSSGTVNMTTASFTFSANEPGTFECELDGTGYVACANPVDYTGLADGPHTFMVKATDAMGYTDLTPASLSWTIDATAPDTTITGGPSGTVSATTASFTFTSEVGATFECQMDAGGYAVCVSPMDYTGLSDGVHTFDVHATDTAGNVDATSASQSWTVDTVIRHTLTATKSGNGTVTSIPSGIDCGLTCSAQFEEHTSVTLNATPDAGNVFEGWSGACSGRDACVVVMTAAKSVAAHFASDTAVTWVDESGVQTACVNTVDSLVNALIDAETDGQPNRIKVVQGTYPGLFAYAGENQDLEILGGYTAACAGRTINPVLTVLDGDVDTSGTPDGVVLDLMVGAAGIGDITVDGFTVRNGINIVDEGGCVRIFTDSGQITANGNIVTGCEAVDAGGVGVATSSGRILITNNIIYNNSAISAGGAGAMTTSGQIVVLNNTITDNSADDPGQAGGGGGLGISLYGNSATADIADNIIWGNVLTAGSTCHDVVIDSDTDEDSTHVVVQFRNNDTTGAGSVCSTDLGFVLGVGNITSNPLFVNSGTDDYHLQNSSPCKDTGLNSHADQPAVDYEGVARIQGTKVDMGASEVWQGLMAVMSPNGGETLTGFARHTITWNVYSGATSYTLSYSTAGSGGPWSTIVSGVTGTSYSWTVPNVATTAGRVRVAAYNGATWLNQDISDGNFTIQMTAGNVTSPNGGKTLTGAGTQTITWNAYPPATSYTLSYSTTGSAGPWTTIATGVIGTSWSWTVPNVATTAGRVRVAAYNGATWLAQDISDGNFTIQGSGNVTSPNGGETLTGLGSHTVTWSVYPGATSYSLAYSTTGSVGPWTTIATGVAGTSYGWTVPNMPVTTARVRVQAYNGGTWLYQDISDADFTIVMAGDVTSPNGGETLTGFGSHTITWNAYGGATSHTLSYSTAGSGGPWTVIATGVTGSSYGWTVPNAATAAGRVKVETYSGAALLYEDISDADFRIFRMGDVTSPNGGEAYAVLSSQTITWVAHSGATSYSVSYSTTGTGGPWTTIATGVTGTSQSWTVPNLATATGRMRIETYDGATLLHEDISDADFSIVLAGDVMSPNGVEVLTGLTTHTVRWNAHPGATSYRVAYSTAGAGGPWLTVATGVVGTSYAWTVPNVASTTMRMRIQSYNGATWLYGDLSNNDFTIQTTAGTMTSPNGGETFAGLSTRTIKWNVYPGATSYTLSYSTTGTGGPWMTIASGVTGTSYVWTVPNIAAAVWVRVASYNGTTWLYQDFSDATVTIERSGDLLNPNGGETFAGLSSQLVEWRAYPGATSYRVGYSTTGSAGPWTMVATGVTGTSCTVSVPNTTTATARVRVQSYNGGTWLYQDMSDADFTIQASGNVVSPNGGETFAGSSSQTVTWRAYSGATSYRVAYSTTGSAGPWVTVATGETGTSYSWTVPNVATTAARIRVQAFNFSTWLYQDFSNADFTISP